MDAYLVVEYSHHDPDASFTLYDRPTYEAVMDNLGQEGWMTEEFTPLEINGKPAQYWNALTYSQAIVEHGIKVLGAQYCWGTED